MIQTIINYERRIFVWSKNELDEENEAVNNNVDKNKEEITENNHQKDVPNNEEKKEILDTQSILSNLKSCSLDDEIEPIHKPKRNTRKKIKKIAEPIELTDNNKGEDDKHTLKNTGEIDQINSEKENLTVEDKQIDVLKEDNIISYENIDHNLKENEKIEEEIINKEDDTQIEQQNLNDAEVCETQQSDAEVCGTQQSDAEVCETQQSEDASMWKHNKAMLKYVKHNKAKLKYVKHNKAMLKYVKHNKAMLKK